MDLDEALHIALERGEVGIQVAAFVDGELALEASAGRMWAEGPPVDDMTLFPILSAGKAVPAIAVHLQAERGLINYDVPVAEYWLEFGQNAKADVTIEHVLSHRAGVPQLPDGTSVDDMCDWELMVDRIAALEPMYRAGTTSSYHALSLGWILGEVVRRTDARARPFGRFVKEDICAPLDIEDLYVGLPSELHDRCATISSRSYVAPDPNEVPDHSRAVPLSIGRPEVFQNRHDFREACVPAGNVIANARSLARLYAMLACLGELDGYRLLRRERVLRMTARRPGFEEVDTVLGRWRPYGIGGFSLEGEPGHDVVLGPGRILWNHGGGGTYAWADLDRRLAVAICHNSLFALPAKPEDHPFAPLAGVIRAALA